MVSAFVQKGLDCEGLFLVYEMQKEGLAIDLVTVTALLSAASNFGSLRLGRETRGYLIRKGIIDKYAKSGCVETARHLFDGDGCDERDQATRNTMIAGYMHNDEPEKAISFFHKMWDRNCLPNHITISLVLPACDPRGIRAGKEIHGFAICQDLDANDFVGMALGDMYSKCGGIISAGKVFNQMKQKNRVTYTTMISGFCQNGLGERDLSLFKTMQSFGILMQYLLSAHISL